MKHIWQTWCDLCHKDLKLGKYEEINGKIICNDCNPKKKKKLEFVYITILNDKE